MMLSLSCFTLFPIAGPANIGYLLQTHTLSISNASDVSPVCWNVVS